MSDGKATERNAGTVSLADEAISIIRDNHQAWLASGEAGFPGVS